MGQPLVGEFLTDQWLFRKRRQVRATTAYRYAWFVDRYIVTALGDIPLRRLRFDHFETFHNELAATGGQHGHALAPKTVLEVHLIVRAALDLTLRRELIARNVADNEHLRPSRSGTSAARIWTDSEPARLLDVAATNRLYPALHLAAHTGMRRGEIAGLKWYDLDLKANRLSIARTLQCVGGQATEFGPKTHTSRRAVELDAGTAELLRVGVAVDSGAGPRRMASRRSAPSREIHRSLDAGRSCTVITRSSWCAHATTTTT